MRTLLAATLLTVLLAFPALAQQAAGIPKLTGVWEAESFQLHHKGKGFLKGPDKARLTVKEQEGRVIHGTVEWGGKAPGKDAFSGVIDKDNVTFYLAGHGEGLRIGKMEGPDAFTFYYIVPGGKAPRAGYVEYKRAR